MSRYRDPQVQVGENYLYLNQLYAKFAYLKKSPLNFFYKFSLFEEQSIDMERNGLPTSNLTTLIDVRELPSTRIGERRDGLLPL